MFKRISAARDRISDSLADKASTAEGFNSVKSEKKDTEIEGG